MSFAKSKIQMFVNNSISEPKKIVGYKGEGEKAIFDVVIDGGKTQKVQRNVLFSQYPQSLARFYLQLYKKKKKLPEKH